MIKLNGVTKTYRMKSGEVHALKGVSLDLPESGMVFVLGKSGCGKSTLLNVVGGLDEITSGEIVVDGVSMSEYRAKDYDMYRNRYIGFIFQEYNLIDGFNVGKNISLALELQQNKDKKSLIENVLEQVGLAGFYNRKINELSGGQKQRVAIARALVKNPRIILADEPTGNLDSATAEEIFGLLKELSSDRLILVVSHDRENAEQYADRIIELKDGEVLSDRTINELSNAQVSPLTVGNDNGKGIASDGEESDAGNIGNCQNQELNHEKEIKGNENYVVQKESCDSFCLEGSDNNKINNAANSTQQQKTELGTENVSKSNRKQRISGNMPFTSALSYAFNNLWHKKIRVIASIVLFIISLALFNFAYATSRFDVYKTTYNTFKEAGYENVALRSRRESKKIDYITAEFGEEAVPIYDSSNYIIDYSEKNEIESGYYNDSVRYAMPIDSEIVEKMGFAKIYGRLPMKSTEICISKYLAESILHIGKPQWDKMGITSIEKLVNNIKDRYGILKVVGIIDTKFPSKYDELRDKSHEEIIYMNNNLSNSFSDQTRATAHVAMLCHESYFREIYMPKGDSFAFTPYMSSTLPFEKRLNAHSANMLEVLDMEYHKVDNLVDGVIVNYSTAKEFVLRAGYGEELQLYNYDTVVELLAKHVINIEMPYEGEPKYEINARIIGVYDDSDKNNPMFNYGKIFMSGTAQTEMFNKVKCLEALLIDVDNEAAMRRAMEISSLIKEDSNFRFNNDVIDEIEHAKQYAEQFKLIGGVAAGIFAIIVVLLLLNYFMSTIKDKNREIGVLRALGVKNSNVISIYVLEAAIISIIAFIVSLPISFAITNLMESSVMDSLALGYNIFVHFIDLGIVSCLVTLALCIGIALIGCIAPFAKLFRRKPMEIIRKQ